MTVERVWSQPRRVSCDQARLLHLWRGSPTARAALQIGSVARLRGDLDLALLRRSLRNVVARHTSLRTSFREDDGHWSPHIHEAVACDLPVLPVLGSGDPALGAGVASLRRLLDEPIDVTRAPLWRARLLSIAPDNHELVFVCHHVVSDHHSVAEFFYELLREYDAGAPARDLAADMTDADDIASEEFLRRETLALSPKHVDFWASQIANTVPVIGMARDDRRNPLATYESDTHSFEVPASLWRDLDEDLRGAGLRPSAALLAAFELLIYRRTQTAPFLVGVAIDGRSGRSARPAMGFLSSPSVVRAELSREDGLLAVAARAQQQLTAILRRRPFPYARLAASIKAEQRSITFPSLQYLFSFIPRAAAESFGLELTKLRGGAGRTSFDLWLTAQLEHGRVSAQIDYARPLFTRDEVVGLSNELVGILDESVQRKRAPSPPRRPVPENRPAWSLAIASTFTAEPLLPMLAAWGAYFERRVELEMAAPARSRRRCCGRIRRSRVAVERPTSSSSEPPTSARSARPGCRISARLCSTPRGETRAHT